MIELILSGRIPSKKNSRINLRSGVSIPSKDFTTWQKDALWQVRTQTHKRFFKPVAIDVIIIFGTKGRADLDNRLTSILDMLVEALIIRDDKWQDVPQMSCRAEYKKGEPGAVVTITEIDPMPD